MTTERFISFYRNLHADHFTECKNSTSKLMPNGRKMQADPLVMPLKSAVMVLCYPEDEEIMMVFIRRTEDRGVHSGQIAFAGGRFDITVGDLNTFDTAIRETHEEIGLLLKKEQVIAALTPLYIPPSNFLVDPYLAIIDKVPVLSPDPAEVAEILHVPLSHLLNDECIVVSEFETRIGKISAPCYSWKNIRIWGATAIMLSEVLCLEKLRRKEGIC